MSEATPRFQLPFLIPGQAQKEHFHNEALTRLDLALHPVVETAALDVPPTNPLPGKSWVIGSVPRAAWSGKANYLAMWTDSGWRFVAPVPGMTVWNNAQALPMKWTGSSWSTGEIVCGKVVIEGQQVLGVRQPAVPSPSGGTVIDVEARAAIIALTAALMSHGLID